MHRDCSRFKKIMQISLNDILGGDFVELDEKKPSSKKAKNNSDKFSKKSPKASGIKLPIFTYVQNAGTYELKPELFDGSDTITSDDVLSYLSTIIPSVVPNSTVDCDADAVYVYNEVSSTVSELKLNTSTVLTFGSATLDVSSILMGSDEDTTISVPDLKSYLSDCGYAFSDINPVVYEHHVSIVLPDVSLTDDMIKSSVHFPFTLKVYGYDDIVITEDMLKVDGSSEPVVTIDCLNKFICERYAFLNKRYYFCCLDTDSNQLGVSIGPSVDSHKSVKNTIKKYKIDGYKISLAYTSYDISKDDFNGRSSVTSEEIFTWLSSVKGHIEYTEDRCSIIEDKDAKLIIVILNGARKGCTYVDPRELERPMIQSCSLSELVELDKQCP